MVRGCAAPRSFGADPRDRRSSASGSTFISGDGTNPVASNFLVPAVLVGFYRLIAVIDPAQMIMETDETNNVGVSASSLVSWSAANRSFSSGCGCNSTKDRDGNVLWAWLLSTASTAIGVRRRLYGLARRVIFISGDISRGLARSAQPAKRASARSADRQYKATGDVRSAPARTAKRRAD